MINDSLSRRYPKSYKINDLYIPKHIHNSNSKIRLASYAYVCCMYI